MEDKIISEVVAIVIGTTGLFIAILIGIVTHFLKRLLDKNDTNVKEFNLNLENTSNNISLLRETMIRKHSEYDIKLDYIKRDLDALSKDTAKDLNNLGNKIISLQTNVK